MSFIIFSLLLSIATVHTMISPALAIVFITMTPSAAAVVAVVVVAVVGKTQYGLRCEMMQYVAALWKGDIALRRQQTECDITSHSEMVLLWPISPPLPAQCALERCRGWWSSTSLFRHRGQSCSLFIALCESLQHVYSHRLSSSGQVSMWPEQETSKRVAWPRDAVAEHVWRSAHAKSGTPSTASEACFWLLDFGLAVDATTWLQPLQPLSESFFPWSYRRGPQGLSAGRIQMWLATVAIGPPAPSYRPERFLQIQLARVLQAARRSIS